MLILASLSGIQDYVFGVRETGGGQARALRARSFRTQIISECIALQLLRALSLPPDRIALRAAAKFAIVVADADEIRLSELSSVLADIRHWLLQHTHGRLRLAVAVSDSRDSAAACYADALRRLARSKLTAWQDIAADSQGWKGDQLVTSDLFEEDAQGDLDRNIGGALASAMYMHYFDDRGGQAAPAQAVDGATEFEAARLHVRLSDNNGSAPGAIHSEPVTRFTFHVPTDPDGHVIEFVDLAARSHGAAMLGVLKADVDSLGKTVGNRLRGASDLQPLQLLSGELNDFFGRILGDEMRGGDAPRHRWRSLYCVFSGGDDILIVGPWNIVMDFAGHLQYLFRQRFSGQEGLTLSAGLAIVKPKFPVRLAVRQAEELLERAKASQAARASAPKDQIAALGGLWKWQDHDRILTAGKQLADWVNAGVIQRGYLYTLLEIALLGRRQMPARSRDIHPAMATARLAYHVARNWPRRDDRDNRKRPARAWIDAILREFDRYESTAHTETIHLPTVIRYAALATRRPKGG